ncbi:MAG: insulinase family protein, partial [Bacteroidales bacterium]|nr:insulinase family protein [Bacteroidales bacterium]
MKKSLIITCALALIFAFSSCSTKKHETKTATDKNGYTYEYVTNDPSGARIYTLENGLKIYLAVNTEQPRIQTYIAVRVGAKDDPRATTGLAHYFEHMMFKGTNKIGTKDWEKESVLIQAISDKFEEYGAETDPEKRTAIYAQIDSLSQVASQYAIANEYDKICSIIGATGTNAWTSYDETVYVNEIPSNEVERWAKVESERFENLVLRLFHTELETIFEEFNMSQDRDGRRLNNTIFSKLFPNHPYGTAVIGKGEHLKSPSMANVMQFKADYYVPNNIAICMSGDLDFEETVKIIDKYWGGIAKNENLQHPTYAKEEERTAIDVVEIHGPEAEEVCLTWRTPNNKSKDSKYLSMIASILYNGNAGLIDLDLNTSQKVLGAYAYEYALNDYGIFEMIAMPLEGQTLEEVKDLLIAEIEKIKKGEFEEWLMEANINAMKLSQIKFIEGNGIASAFVDAFISQTNWEDAIFEIEEYEMMTKDELVKFANEFFKDNYIVAYKRLGEPENVMHVDKPAITQLNIDRDSESTFITELKKEEPQPISPEFVNYSEKIQETEIAKDLPFSYIKNTTNDLFDLTYILDMGKDNDKKLSLAIDYLEYLGTTDKKIEELKAEWYKLGCNFSVSSGSERCYVSIDGLDKNFEQAMKLMEEV